MTNDRSNSLMIVSSSINDWSFDAMLSNYNQKVRMAKITEEFNSWLSDKTKTDRNHFGLLVVHDLSSACYYTIADTSLL